MGLKVKLESEFRFPFEESEAPKVIGQSVKFSCKWLSLVETEYTLSPDKPHKWESVARTGSKDACKPADGAEVVALVTSSKLPGTHVVFVVNFRPAVGRFVLELPGGLLDSARDSVEETAVRELLEETGLTGIARKKTFVTHCDPWKSTETSAMVVVDVNLDCKENVEAKQRLEETELIFPVMFPLSTPEGLVKRVQAFCKKHSVAVDARVASLSTGLDLAKGLL